MSHRRKLGAESGQSLLEVALVTPLLLLLVLGVIEIGRYAYIAILVGNAAHAGAAYGSQGATQAGDTNGIQLAADNDYQNNGQLVSTLTVTSWTTCGCDSNGTISMTQAPNQCSTATNSSIATTISTCESVTGRHWVSMVSVEASGKYSSLFNYPGIPTPVTIDRTATIRVSN